jgi:hypothetical protein
MTLTHVIFGSLGLALMMIIIGWFLERLHLRTPVTRAEGWYQPQGAWDWGRTRPGLASRERSGDKIYVH